MNQHFNHYEWRFLPLEERYNYIKFNKRQYETTITPNDDISVDIYHGKFFDNAPPSAIGYAVGECKGGYLRAYDDQKDSLMLVLRPKEKEDVQKKD